MSKAIGAKCRVVHFRICKSSLIRSSRTFGSMQHCYCPFHIGTPTHKFDAAISMQLNRCYVEPLVFLIV
jgi:hypothetical protein